MVGASADSFAYTPYTAVRFDAKQAASLHDPLCRLPSPSWLVAKKSKTPGDSP